MAVAVNRTTFSIGYMEQAYDQGLTLPFAAIHNQAGNYVTPVRPDCRRRRCGPMR